MKKILFYSDKSGNLNINDKINLSLKSENLEDNIVDGRRTIW